MVTREEARQVVTAEARIALEEFAAQYKEEVIDVEEWEIKSFFNGIESILRSTAAKLLKDNQSFTAFKAFGFGFNFFEYDRESFAKQVHLYCGLTDPVCERMLGKLDELLEAHGSRVGHVELEGIGMFSKDSLEGYTLKLSNL